MPRRGLYDRSLRPGGERERWRPPPPPPLGGGGPNLSSSTWMVASPYRPRKSEPSISLIALSMSSGVSNSTTPRGPFLERFTSAYKGGAIFLKWSLRSCQDVPSGMPRTAIRSPVALEGGPRPRPLSSNLSLLSGRPRATSTRSLEPMKSLPSLARTASSASL